MQVSTAAFPSVMFGFYTEMMHISSVGIYTGCYAQSEEAYFLTEQYYLTDLLGGLEISCPSGKLTNLWKLSSIVQVFFVSLNDTEEEKKEKGYYKFSMFSYIYMQVFLFALFKII